MYFVNRQKIAAMLDYVDHLLVIFHDQKWESEINKLALERLTQNLIESIIDVGNQMIDGFIMRDPGGYEDIIDILEDEAVLPHEEAIGIKQLIMLRKTLVRDYLTIDHQKMAGRVAANEQALCHFSGRIRTYLDQELGPVSAFSAKPKA
ncbi:MAG: DUF86 domain-containing protein [Sporolactobacillus sp.]